MKAILYCTLPRAVTRPPLKFNIMFDGGSLWQRDILNPADEQDFLSVGLCLDLLEEYFSKINIEVQL